MVQNVKSRFGEKLEICNQKLSCFSCNHQYNTNFINIPQWGFLVSINYNYRYNKIKETSPETLVQACTILQDPFPNYPVSAWNAQRHPCSYLAMYMYMHRICFWQRENKGKESDQKKEPGKICWKDGFKRGLAYKSPVLCDSRMPASLHPYLACDNRTNLWYHMLLVFSYDMYNRFLYTRKWEKNSVINLLSYINV